MDKLLYVVRIIVRVNNADYAEMRKNHPIVEEDDERGARDGDEVSMSAEDE